MENTNSIKQATRKDVLTKYWNGHLATKLASEINLINLQGAAKTHGENTIIGQVAQAVPGVPTPTLKQITIKDQIKTEENNLKTVIAVMKIVEDLINKEK